MKKKLLFVIPLVVVMLLAGVGLAGCGRRDNSINWQTPTEEQLIGEWNRVEVRVGPQRIRPGNLGWADVVMTFFDDGTYTEVAQIGPDDHGTWYLDYNVMTWNSQAFGITIEFGIRIADNRLEMATYTMHGLTTWVYQRV